MTQIRYRALRSFTIALSMTLTSQVAAAAEPLSASDFEAYVTGKTLYFGLSGQAYGAEEYLPNRRVRWSYLDGDCKEGYWYEEASQICFVYEDSPDPQCWSFFAEDKGLRAIFENNPGSTVLYEAEKVSEPMLCYGPDVGV